MHLQFSVEMAIVIPWYILHNLQQWRTLYNTIKMFFDLPRWQESVWIVRSCTFAAEPCKGSYRKLYWGGGGWGGVGECVYDNFLPTLRCKKEHTSSCSIRRSVHCWRQGFFRGTGDTFCFPPTSIPIDMILVLHGTAQSSHGPRSKLGGLGTRHDI